MYRHECIVKELGMDIETSAHISVYTHIKHLPVIFMCAYIHTNMDAAVAIYLHGYVHICMLHLWISAQNHVCLYTHKHTRVCMCVHTHYICSFQRCVYTFTYRYLYV